MKPTIFDNQKVEQFFTAEGCFITELSNSDIDPQCSVAQARVEPGITTSWHRLKDTVERYCIIQGEGLLEIGDLPARRLTVGDFAIIPAMCRQRITNTGQQSLIFQAICTPRFLTSNYQLL
ncbi:MAG: cupin domain-containing protein [Immundisolibacteraceae bacterium]|nr:cupin domain-containing protein [Immundisolibacteraceae bacterium]